MAASHMADSLGSSSPATYDMPVHNDNVQAPNAAVGYVPSKAGWYAQFKAAAKKLKRSVLALYYAAHDPAVGWLPRCIAAFVLAYALSPFDLIPDFIPILGFLDDMILLPGLIYLAIYLIPADAWERGCLRADSEPLRLQDNWAAACVILLMWDTLAIGLAYWLVMRYGNATWQQQYWAVLLVVGGVLVIVESVWVGCQLRAEAQRKAEECAEAGGLSASLLGGAAMSVAATDIAGAALV